MAEAVVFAELVGEMKHRSAKDSIFYGIVRYAHNERIPALRRRAGLKEIAEISAIMLRWTESCLELRVLERKAFELEQEQRSLKAKLAKRRKQRNRPRLVPFDRLQ